MGYYTNHKLVIVEGNDNATDYENEIETIADYANVFCESVKWYDRVKMMTDYSKRHPKTIFKIIGEGEENGDLWHEYYVNGKMQRVVAEIVYKPFDESKLK